MSDTTLKASIVYARAEYVICPHCDAEVDGWYNDPRGVETKCDECGKAFAVDANAQVRMT